MYSFPDTHTHILLRIDDSRFVLTHRQWKNWKLAWALTGPGSSGGRGFVDGEGCGRGKW